MRIPAPKTITIGGKTFDVVLDDSLIALNSKAGEFDPHRETITIDSHLPPTSRTEVLLHESLEAINDIWLDESLAHGDINRLGEALLQLLNSLGVEIEWN